MGSNDILTFKEEDLHRASIKAMIYFIGDDPNREGVRETPSRVVKSWSELFSGYKKDPKEIFKTFDKGTYNQMVLLRNVEFYSTCEHHMLPFFGHASIAYIPGKRIIGLSKLARLLDIYAKRLQVQERLTEEVTKALDEHLAPLGSACVIEAKHTCMCGRGAMKQDATMVTSSISGEFYKPEVRAELFNLIKG